MRGDTPRWTCPPACGVRTWHQSHCSMNRVASLDAISCPATGGRRAAFPTSVGINAVADSLVQQFDQALAADGHVARAGCVLDAVSTN